jgi:uncharacterized protein (DUF1778 family)
METTKLTVRLDAALMRILKATAATKGTTVQAFVVGAITAKLKKRTS